jgi:hypothetical protein
MQMNPPISTTHSPYTNYGVNNNLNVNKQSNNPYGNSIGAGLNIGGIGNTNVFAADDPFADLDKPSGNINMGMMNMSLGTGANNSNMSLGTGANNSNMSLNMNLSYVGMTQTNQSQFTFGQNMNNSGLSSNLSQNTGFGDFNMSSSANTKKSTGGNSFDLI